MSTVAVKERPILFSGEMVRAILDGRKTQTRRIVKPQPKDVGFGRNCEVHPYCTGTNWPLAYYERRGGCWNSSDRLRSPYGQPGDRLWVRETFAVASSQPYDDGHEDEVAIYRATDAEQHFPRKWRPSIFMPRWASRITLEITGIRVERLQDISEGDAKAEGVQTVGYLINPFLTGAGNVRFSGERSTHRTEYRNLWDNINGEGSWAANPWVWVIEFKRI